MSKKEDNMSSISGNKSKQMPQLTPEKQFQLEIRTFYEFYRSLPNSTKLEMQPYIQTLMKEVPKDSKIHEISWLNGLSGFTVSQGSGTADNVVTMMVKLLGLNLIGGKVQKIDPLISARKSSINLEINQNSFNPINAIHPKFEYYYKMSRELDQNGHGFNHQKPGDSELYAPPRLFVRLQERKHLKNSTNLKGNILLLAVEGNAMTGRNAFAVTSKNSVQWWEKNDESFINNIIEEEKPSQEKGASVRNEKDKSAEEPFQRLQLKYKITSHHGKITSVSVSYDQLYMLTAGTDNVVKLWCLRSKMQLCEYKCHLKTIWSVNFCQSGYFFLTGSADCLVKLWKTDEASAIRIFSGHDSDVLKVQFMRNPDMVISSSNDGTIIIWNIIQASLIQKFHLGSPVFNFCLSFSGRYISACSSTGVITLFDLVKGIRLNTFSISSADAKKGSGEVNGEQKEKNDKKLLIHDMCFSQNDHEFACISSKYIMMYSMDTLSQKMAGNIFSLYGEKQQDIAHTRLSPTQVIHIGRDINLFYCRYHPKNYLIVGGANRKY